MKIEITQPAWDDMGDTRSYYREQGIPEKGRRFILEILKKIERLASFPDSGRVVPEFEMEFVREIIFSPFRIVYQRDPNKIWIIRVWRSERQLKLD